MSVNLWCCCDIVRSTVKLSLILNFSTYWSQFGKVLKSMCPTGHHSFIHTYIHSRMHSFIHAFIHTYINSYIWCLHAIRLMYLMHVFIHSCDNSCIWRIHSFSASIHSFNAMHSFIWCIWHIHSCILYMHSFSAIYI